MSQSQGIEVRRPSRRAIATGAAWAVPVIAVGAAAPLAAASVTPCVPEFVTTQGSFKCCNGGPKKNMKLVIKINDANNCLNDGQDIVCVTKVELANGQPIGQVVFGGGGNSACTPVGGTFTVYLLDTSSCTVNINLTYSVNGGPAQVAALKSDNIPSGNTTGDCEPPKP